MHNFYGVLEGNSSKNVVCVHLSNLNGHFSHTLTYLIVGHKTPYLIIEHAGFWWKRMNEHAETFVTNEHGGKSLKLLMEHASKYANIVKFHLYKRTCATIK